MADSRLNPTTTRRSILAGVAVTIPAAAVAGPLSADTDCDVGLIELGRKLDEAVIASRAFRPTYDAACDAISAGMNDPENQQAFRLAKREHGNDGFSIVYRRLFGEEDKVIGRGNDLMAAANKLAEEILSRPARTIAGLGVHVRALSWTFRSAWDGPLEEADYDKAAVRRFVENLCPLAGVAPLPDMEAAHV